MMIYMIQRKRRYPEPKGFVICYTPPQTSPVLYVATETEKILQFTTEIWSKVYNPKIEFHFLSLAAIFFSSSPW